MGGGGRGERREDGHCLAGRLPHAMPLQEEARHLPHPHTCSCTFMHPWHTCMTASLWAKRLLWQSPKSRPHTCSQQWGYR